MALEPESKLSQATLPGGVLIEPKGKLPPHKLEALVNLSYGQPGYPLKQPFETEYPVSDRYDTKYALAVSLLSHPRYTKLRFLVSNFIPDGVEVPPEADILRQHLQYRVREELLKRGDRTEKKTAEDDLKKFAEDVSHNNTPDADEFRKLVGLFGSSRVVDILYGSRPEFRGIPIEKVRGVLADYLGDFLLAKGHFDVEDLEPGIQYLSDPNLKEGLVEVIKDSCLSICQQQKKADPSVDLKATISEYLDGILAEASKFDQVNLWEVVYGLFDYYDSLFKITVPPQMVTQLREGRDFPDLSQLINIKEIEDKKRYVEGDDMGMGKSLPPIVVKERQGIKTAVVVAPASVINDPDTWLTYLSDRVDPDGKQRGYFKQGMSPSVLVVESLDQLRDPEIHSYDYILLSHNRLTDEYTDEILKLDYRMLIVDESHKLKRLTGGVWGQNLVKLTEKIEGDDDYLVLISGTPVPNKIMDVGMLLRHLYPEEFRNVDDRTLVRSIIQGEYVDLRTLLMPRMQLKNIHDSLDLPPLTEETITVEMSEVEREIYGILLEEDEIEATEKIRILRQFLLNPDLLNVTPGVESSKIQALNVDLQQKFESHDRVVYFFNDYIEGVIRGDNSILSKLDLPEGVVVRVITGETSKREREAIFAEFRSTDQKMLLLISGETVDVGVNLSRGQAVGHYNLPWTVYRKRQQISRVYREGIEAPMTATSLIVGDSIEEGIDKYTFDKFKAIEKLLRGIPITELEQELLEKSEDQDESGLEVNPELAEYYFSAWDRMRKIFAYVKEIGEVDFKRFLEEYGRDYAQCYVDLGSRSYQANACRISSTLLDLMVKERKQQVEDIRILDVASGPEMLRRHIPGEYSSRVISVDINPLHFTSTGSEGGDRVVGSFLTLPFTTGAFDYINMSLAWHYANFTPSKGEVERLEVLRELHRVLKVGGRAVINSIYSLDIRDEAKLREVVETVGFRLVEEYTGEASSGRNYQSKVYTLEKQHDFGWTLPETLQLIGRENHDGLKFRRTDIKLRDTRRIVKAFSLDRLDGGSLIDQIPVAFNRADFQVLVEEESIIHEGEGLKHQFGSIADIPRDIIIDRDFIRVRIGKRYALFKRLETAGGVVVLK